MFISFYVVSYPSYFVFSCFFFFALLRFVLSFIVSFSFCTLFMFLFLSSFGFCFWFFRVSLRFIHLFYCGILFTFISCFFAPFSFYGFCFQSSLFGFDFIFILSCRVTSLSCLFVSSFALCSIPSCLSCLCAVYPTLHPFSFLLLSLVCFRFCSFFSFVLSSFDPVCCVLFCLSSLSWYFIFYFSFFVVIFRFCLVFPRRSFLSHFSLSLFVFVERVAFFYRKLVYVYWFFRVNICTEKSRKPDKEVYEDTFVFESTHVRVAFCPPVTKERNYWFCQIFNHIGF